MSQDEARAYLQKVMQDHELNPSTLAHRIQRSPSTIWRVCEGNRSVTADLIDRISTQLALTPEEQNHWFGLIGTPAQQNAAYTGRLSLSNYQLEEARWLHDHQGWSWEKIAPLFHVHRVTLTYAVHRDQRIKVKRRPCKDCGTWFRSSDSRQQFCSQRCTKRVSDRRYRRKKRAELRMKPAPIKKKRLNIEVTPDLFDQVQDICDRRGESMSSLVRQGLAILMLYDAAEVTCPDAKLLLEVSQKQSQLELLWSKSLALSSTRSS